MFTYGTVAFHIQDFQNSIHFSRTQRKRERKKVYNKIVEIYIYNFRGGAGGAVQKNICVLKKLKCRNNDSKSQRNLNLKMTPDWFIIQDSSGFTFIYGKVTFIA